MTEQRADEKTPRQRKEAYPEVQGVAHGKETLGKAKKKKHEKKADEEEDEKKGGRRSC